MKSFTHSVGSLFQPIFHLFGWLLAFFYGLIPNYGAAIILLTIVIMGALTPFTIKSTKSMVAMQKLQPEIKKLQQKYKGPENRQMLNDEMMKLYREEGANPLGGCLPVLLQAPFLFILYSVIKGLAYTTVTKGVITAHPRYIPHSSKMYDNLVSSHGQIKVFGMDLNLKAFSVHSSFTAQIPFFIFVAVAVGFQYFQMAQLNNRNRKAGTPMPAQQQMMQRFLPVFFAYFYLIIPAAVVLYMIVSTGIRIITQDLMFRAGVTNPQKNGAKPVEKELPPSQSAVKKELPPAPNNVKKQLPPAPNNVKKQTPKPSTIKPQAQSRSKAKRKRKER
jgi:YidC/Oxa1 family membrane protein insertase